MILILPEIERRRSTILVFSMSLYKMCRIDGQPFHSSSVTRLVVHRTPFQFLSAPSLLSFSLPPPIALGEHFPFGADCDEGTEREGNEQRIHPEEAQQWRQCRFSAPRPTPLRSYSFSGLDGSCPSFLIPHLSSSFYPSLSPPPPRCLT